MQESRRIGAQKYHSFFFWKGELRPRTESDGKFGEKRITTAATVVQANPRPKYLFVPASSFPLFPRRKEEAVENDRGKEGDPEKYSWRGQGNKKVLKNGLFSCRRPGRKVALPAPFSSSLWALGMGVFWIPPKKERCGGWGFLGRPALQSDNSRRLHTPNVDGTLPYRTKATFLARSDPGGRKGRQINILVSSAPRPSGTVRRGRSRGERERMEDKCAAQKCAAPRPLPAAAASGQSFKSCPFRGWPH